MTYLKSSAICFLLVAGSAQAEGFYVSGAVGSSHFTSSLNNTAVKQMIDNDFGTPVTSSKHDDDDSAYKIQLGYKINENFAVEAGYVRLGEQKITVGLGSDFPSLLINGSGHQTLKVSGINVDGLLLLPINAGFSWFFKAGILDAQVKSDFDTSATATTISGSFIDSLSESDSKSIRKVSANAGAGLNYNFFKGASVRLEYELFNNVGDKHKTGTANVGLASLGLSYEF